MNKILDNNLHLVSTLFSSASGFGFKQIWTVKQKETALFNSNDSNHANGANVQVHPVCYN